MNKVDCTPAVYFVFYGPHLRLCFFNNHADCRGCKGCKSADRKTEDAERPKQKDKYGKEYPAAMKTIIEDRHIEPYASRLFDMYFGQKKIAVFDIETTGLSPASCTVILSGILQIRGGSAQVIQLFADQEDDEAEIIRKTLQILQSADAILTYNGRHFDLPFMEARAKKHGITGFSFPCNLDLYLVVSGHSPLRQILPSLRQKSLEVFMGLSDSRSDEISGGESVELYHRYRQTRSFALEKKILLHNHDDLFQLYNLLPIIEKCDFHRAMFRLGFPAGSFQIRKIAFSGRELRVAALQPQDRAIDYISFPTEEAPYSLRMSSLDHSLELAIPCESASGALYIDLFSLLGSAAAEMEKYPSAVDGYLILLEGAEIHHMEINAFLLKFFRYVLTPVVFSAGDRR